MLRPDGPLDARRERGKAAEPAHGTVGGRVVDKGGGGPEQRGPELARIGAEVPGGRRAQFVQADIHAPYSSRRPAVSRDVLSRAALRDTLDVLAKEPDATWHEHVMSTGQVEVRVAVGQRSVGAVVHWSGGARTRPGSAVPGVTARVATAALRGTGRLPRVGVQ